MAEPGLLIDITHMSEHAQRDTFALLDELDPARRVPLLASHIARRLGSFEYNVCDETIAAVGARDGVLGVIACEHFVQATGVTVRQTRGRGRDTVCIHIDHVHDVTGSHDDAARNRPRWVHHADAHGVAGRLPVG
jgi:microsomal dipeptidase-like Zn-dependent dipeptidase